MSCQTHDDIPYPAGHPFDGLEFLIAADNCDRCAVPVPWNASVLEEALEIAVSSPLWCRSDEDWRKVRAAFIALTQMRNK